MRRMGVQGLLSGRSKPRWSEEEELFGQAHSLHANLDAQRSSCAASLLVRTRLGASLLV